MPCEDRHKQIDGHKWTVTQMAPREALKLETRLIGPIMQSLGPLIGALGKGEADQSEAISTAFAAVSTAFPPEELADLVIDLCSDPTLLCDGKKIDFDQAFQGGKGVLLRYKIVAFVLEANFGDFFTGLFPGFDLEKGKTMITSRLGGAPSTGESGESALPSRPSAD